jgi:hypothetical protein
MAQFNKKVEPLFYALKGFAGLLSFILGLVIYIHLYCWILLTVQDVPVAPFLNNMLEGMEESNISFIATVFFTFFGFYMFICAVVGNIKLGMRFYVVTFYPMM